MHSTDETDNDRRRFLASAGKFALATPPAITLLLAAEGRNYVYAGSGKPAKEPNGNAWGWHRKHG